MRDVGRPFAPAGGEYAPTADAGGGLSIPSAAAVAPITFDLPEAIALMSSLAVLGPSVSPGATSTLRKLAKACSKPVSPDPSVWASEAN